MDCHVSLTQFLSRIYHGGICFSNAPPAPSLVPLPIWSLKGHVPQGSALSLFCLYSLSFSNFAQCQFLQMHSECPFRYHTPHPKMDSHSILISPIALPPESPKSNLPKQPSLNLQNESQLLLLPPCLNQLFLSTVLPQQYTDWSTAIYPTAITQVQSPSLRLLYLNTSTCSPSNLTDVSIATSVSLLVIWVILQIYKEFVP